MLSSSFDAIVPMLCAGAGALVIMLAEAWRDRGEKMPLGILGIIALVASGAGLVLLWVRNASSFTVVVADNFGLFVSLVIVVVGIMSILFSSQVIERDGLPAGEFYSLLLFAVVGMIMMA